MWLPFSCPLDHVLNVSALDDDPASFGWPLSIREAGFTSSPRVPASMKVHFQSQAVQACGCPSALSRAEHQRARRRPCQLWLAAEPSRGWLYVQPMSACCHEVDRASQLTAQQVVKYHATTGCQRRALHSAPTGGNVSPVCTEHATM